MTYLSTKVTSESALVEICSKLPNAEVWLKRPGTTTCTCSDPSRPLPYIPLGRIVSESCNSIDLQAISVPEFMRAGAVKLYGPMEVPSSLDVDAWYERRLAAYTSALAVQLARANLATAEIRVELERVAGQLAHTHSYLDRLGLGSSISEFETQQAPLAALSPEPHRLAQTADIFVDHKFSYLTSVEIGFRATPGRSHQIEITVFGSSGRQYGTCTAALNPDTDQLVKVDCEPSPLVEEVLKISIKCDDILNSMLEGSRHSRVRIAIPDGDLEAECLPPVLRICTGLFSSSRGASTPTHAARHSPERRTITELPRAKPYATPKGKPPSWFVRWVPERDAVLVHPYGQEPVVAIVRKVRIPPGLHSISAIVSLDHDQACTSQFWLEVRKCSQPRSDPQSGFTTRLVRQLSVLGSRIKSFAGGETTICTLRGRGLGRVRTDFEADGSEYDLYLITRNTTSDSSFAWAHFRTIFIEAR